LRFYVLVVVVAESFTALGRNDARPMAGRAKLIVGFIGECCFGDELDDVGDDADEHEVTVSVEPLRIWVVDIGRIFVGAKRAAAAAAATEVRGLFGGRIELLLDWFGSEPDG